MNVSVVRVVGSIASEKVTLTLAVVMTSVAPSAGATVVTVGAVASTVQAWLAGVGSVFPSTSVARTWKVCSPSAKPVYSAGEVQRLKAASSRAHSYVAISSFDEKVNVADVLLARSAGPASIVVSGAVVSTVQSWLAGVGSALPAASMARTSKAWAPSGSSP